MKGARVRAPASTANLGPGFDCLGAALSFGLEVTVRRAPGRRDVSLVGKAVEALSGSAEVEVEIEGGFAAGRGLGFSAAEVAAGLLAACELEGIEADPRHLLAVGTGLEGHPDNLAAALYGGITLVLPPGQGQGNPQVLAFKPSLSVRPAILLPRESLETKKARRALPESVPRTDAVENVARTSGLLAMLSGSHPPARELLLECTEDRLHQPYRAPLMPATARVIAELREGGMAAAVSGAGPSVLCLVVEEDEERLGRMAGDLEGWELLMADWDEEGARIL